MSASTIDLHNHSQASDGALTPTELVRRAHAAGVQTLALTDHDSTDGLAEAATEAARLGLQLVTGVEISCLWQRRTIHVVGLDIDPAHPQLRAGLALLQSERQQRAERIAARLGKLGLRDALPRAQAAGGGQLTRTHFARLLVEDGIAKDLKQAFKRYMVQGKLGYVAAQWVPMDTAITWIHAAGGRAVLAHPMRYSLSGAWRERLFAAFSECGGDAAEISTANPDLNERQLVTRLCQAHGLMGSAGSDFHSPEQSWIQHGRLAPLPEGIAPVWSGFRTAITRSH